MTGRYRRRAARRLHRLPPLLGALPRRRGRPQRRSTEIEDNLAIDGRHLRRDGHRQHDGVPRRGARHEPAGQRRRPRRARRPPARSPRRPGTQRGPADRRQASRRTRSSRASRSRTRCGCCWRIGGSTNAVIHLDGDRRPRSASRSTCASQRAQRDHAGAREPQADRRQHYMEDFHAAGGIAAVLRELQAAAASRLRDRHRRDARRAPRRTRRTGSTAPSSGPSTSRFRRRAGWSRCSATSRRAARSSSARPPIRALFEHDGRAVVFKILDDLAARIDDPDLDVAARRRAGAAERRADRRRACPRRATCPSRPSSHARA